VIHDVTSYQVEYFWDLTTTQDRYQSTLTCQVLHSALLSVGRNHMAITIILESYFLFTFLAKSLDCANTNM